MNKISNSILDKLYEMKDQEYLDFNSKLIPNLDKSVFIGVRAPLLRQYAAQLRNCEDTAIFLMDLPHRFFEENQLHAFIIEKEKDFDKCLEMVEKFLPYVDNWATCDQLSPKVFSKNTYRLIPCVRKWIVSEHTYTVRYSIGILMKYFLDNDFNSEYPEMVCQCHSNEYYINMMRAWYMATAMAKQYDNILPYFTDNCLDVWTHNKAIQKATESFRISPDNKTYLRTLKRK